VEWHVRSIRLVDLPIMMLARGRAAMARPTVVSCKVLAKDRTPKATLALLIWDAEENQKSRQDAGATKGEQQVPRRPKDGLARDDN